MKTTFLMVALATLTLSGCGRWFRDAPDLPPGEFSYRVEPQIQDVRRIAVLPAFLASGVGRSASAIDESTGRSWRELGLFEVVTLREQPGRPYFREDPLGNADIPSESLRRLRADHNVDAVLLTRVEHFQSYDPIAIGVTTHLVSCHDGSVFWSATGEWDGTIDAVQDDIRNWWASRMGSGQDRLGGWKLTLSTPRYFTRYVSDRLAESVRSGIPLQP